jgi:acyl-CoA thioester hydrolase
MNLEPLPVTHQAVIPESYRDDMGHVNVTWYTYMFDQATVRLFELFGMDRRYYDANHAGSFALTQHTRYLAEVHIGESVEVRSRLLGRSAKRLHFLHFLTKAGGVLASTTELLGTHIDLSTRRSSPFPPSIANALDRLLAEHAALDWEAPVCGAIRP